jgi:pimeloyl-ACP methyl ester carboxylesterase
VIRVWRGRRAQECERDFVPWRFSAAGRRSAWLDRHHRRSKTCTILRMDQSQQLLSFAAAFGSIGEEGIAIRADAGLAMSAKPSHLIVTVHGIRTYGHWQERLEQLVTAAAGDHDVEFVNYKFGYFSAISFAIPFLRWLLVRRFRNDFARLCAARPRARIDLVGHSFGTHVIAWAIAGSPADTKVPINTIIMSGSVLRSAFPWHEYLGSRLFRVINDCGSKDAVLLISQFLVFFTGMA